MTIHAIVFEPAGITLWGLNPEERLHRQLNEIGKTAGAELKSIRWIEHTGKLPASGSVLLFNGSFIFEHRTVEAVIATQNGVLQHEGQTAAAFVEAGLAAGVIDHMRDRSLGLPEGLTIVSTEDLKAFDTTLRRSTKPLLEPVTSARKKELENKLYGNAYRGITDLVTKFVWPRPAKRAVHICAGLGLTPNMVTSIGLLLVIAACFLFAHQYYAWGLLAGWIMTFLDTVDGKLARVTVNSSKFGHLYDHLIDLIHPPIWYIIWGGSLVGFGGALGFSLDQMNWAIVIAYISGRIVEGLFPLLGSCEVFTWRPADAWFRLITARRNPCMILLTLSLFAGRPDWGFIAVTFWTVLSTVILNLRLVYAVFFRLRHGPLTSWLSAEDVATGPDSRSYAIFGATTVPHDES